MVTYLLGAGASANALPVVEEISQLLVNYSDDPSSIFHQYILGERNKMTSDEQRGLDKIYYNFTSGVNWLRNNIQGSIDQFAHQLYHDRRHEEYNRLKSLLSGFFTFEQLTHRFSRCFVFNGSTYQLPPIKRGERNIDPRYNFFWTLLKNGFQNTQYRDQVRILSWNYDVQPELSYQSSFLTKFNSSDSLRSHIIGDLQVFPNYFRWLAQPFDESKFSLTKLNGTAGHYRGQDGAFHNGGANLFGNEDITFQTIKDILSDVYYTSNVEPKSPMNKHTSLFFACEHQDSGLDTIKKAIERTKDTDILYIIGYSFPDYNRIYDTMIISEMKKLKTVYILDTTDGVKRVMGEVQDVLGTRKTKVEIKPKTDVTKFTLPQELYDSFIPKTSSKTVVPKEVIDLIYRNS